MYVVLCKFNDWYSNFITIYIGTFTTKNKAENAIIESTLKNGKINDELRNLSNYEIEEYELDTVTYL